MFRRINPDSLPWPPLLISSRRWLFPLYSRHWGSILKVVSSGNLRKTSFGSHPNLEAGLASEAFGLTGNGLFALLMARTGDSMIVSARGLEMALSHQLVVINRNSVNDGLQFNRGCIWVVWGWAGCGCLRWLIWRVLRLVSLTAVELISGRNSRIDISHLHWLRGSFILWAWFLRRRRSLLLPFRRAWSPI